MSGDPVVDRAEPLADGTPWERLSPRMIWVDALQAVVALTPLAVSLLVLGPDGSVDQVWPAVAIAVGGTFGAVGDAYRWFVTRFRITDEYVEARTGLLVRTYRSIPRDRIRTVDIDARLRHRIGGIRLVSIGAGQQGAVGDAALDLDALGRADAERLRTALLGPQQVASGRAPAGAPDLVADDDEQVLAVLDPRWVVFNMFTAWGYLAAAGVVWGATWMASSIGVDLGSSIVGLADWDALGWGWSIAIGVAAATALAVVSLVVAFFAEFWGFRLTRVQGRDGTILRTTRGLLRTREVNRDENRIRGAEISEPLLWRWMGMADTSVITTGLDTDSWSSPATILPRGPIGVAREITDQVLDAEPHPLVAPLARHPAAAGRRRRVWAGVAAAGMTGALGGSVAAGIVPPGALLGVPVVWLVCVLLARTAYRALGHAVVGPYAVVRSGLANRTTSALQRSAVSGVTLRQSLLQRRLGLRSVALSTAAGGGAVYLPDLDTDDAVAFADAAANGLLQPFLEPAG